MEPVELTEVASLYMYLEYLEAALADGGKAGAGPELPGSVWTSANKVRAGTSRSR